MYNNNNKKFTIYNKQQRQLQKMNKHKLKQVILVRGYGNDGDSDDDDDEYDEIMCGYTIVYICWVLWKRIQANAKILYKMT